MRQPPGLKAPACGINKIRFMTIPCTPLHDGSGAEGMRLP